MLPNRYIGKDFGKSSILTIFSIAPDFFAVFEQVISLESVKKHAHNGGTWNRHDPVFQYFLKGEKMKNGKFLFLAAASLMLAACGGNNAGAIHKSLAGVRTLAVSAPCRYIHSPSGVVSVSDIDAVYRLAKAMLFRAAAGEIK